MKLSENFTLDELLRSEAAHRIGIPAQFNPSPEIVENLRKLCVNVLQPLRDYFGHPIQVTSGYRHSEVNRAIGGSATSAHVYGRAADLQLTIDGKNCNQQLFDAVVKLNLPFRQMIDEFGTEDEPAWIHIEYNDRDNKKEKLRARKVNGRTQYTRI